MFKPSLPHDFDEDYYWNNLHREPLAFWQTAIDKISSENGLPATGWQRAAGGRNIVLLLPDVAVIKLAPPFWNDEIPRESAALHKIAGQLPVETPRLLGQGVFEQWPYLLISFVSGTMLATHWPSLTKSAKCSLAFQQGQLGAALHQLEVDDDTVPFDWAGRIRWQTENAVRRQTEGGVAANLVADLPRFLQKVGPLHRPEAPKVLVQGDLSAINLMVNEENGQLKLTGLVDLGDATIGPAAHEFISPLVHQFRGDKAPLHAFYRGYGLPEEKWSLAWQEHLMARIAIYYAGYLPHILQNVPQTTARNSWEELATELCQLKT